jgi:hypothetical protein
MRRLRLAAEDGYTMAAVMLVLLATSMLAGATFAAVNGDIPFARASQDRKQAYAAAEAGIEYYLYQLTRDNDYWTQCASAPGPNGEPNPVNLKNPGAGRRWRQLAGSTDARFSIELLPANGTANCDTAAPEDTLIDSSTGTFRIRATGESRGVRRSLVTTFRRNSFLDYLYFTDYEALDPLSLPNSTDQAYAAANCVQYRATREQNSWCKTNTSITFPDWDVINGPLHTNDDLLTCGNPKFGRVGKHDTIGIVGPAPNGYTVGSGCAGAPTFNGTKRHPANKLDVPTSNTRLKDATLTTPVNYLFYGQTTITLDGSNTMDVTTYTSSLTPVTYTDYPVPPNGVVFVEKVGGCQIDPPRQLDYNDGAGCAVLTVRGQYGTSMTLGSRDDILIDGNLTQKPGSDAVMGLIAQRFVRVKHDVSGTCGSNIAGGFLQNMTIEAAILALNDSFVVDNYPCGNALGTLTVNGAIAQRFRGAVGTFSGSTRVSGYAKNYSYDDRLRYRNPPFFLDPVAASWRVIRHNEQVPAAQ